MAGSESATLAQRRAIAQRLIASLGELRLPVAPRVPRERFILFAPPLVRAILDGRKTVTRRLITPQPVDGPTTRCPLGLPGDRLWVREKWGHREQFFDRHAPAAGPFIYAADGAPAGAKFFPWKTSLHMPRVASRLLLEITHVRAERVTHISTEDAAAEGCPVEQRHDPVAWFQGVWDQYNAGAACSWQHDPWVWRISFRRITR